MNINSPPKLAAWILSRFVYKGENTEKLGDLEEGFWMKAEDEGILQAKLWYWWMVILVIPVSLKNYFTWGGIMFKNYLKIAFRNILRQKGYSFINISGLALGIACCIFIFMWVNDELSYDNYNKNIDNLYRVEQDYYYEDQTFHINVTPTAAGPAYKDKIPEVLNACRINRAEILLGYNEIQFYESNVRLIDSTFMEMFTLDLLKGDKHSALDQPTSIIINDEIAKKYFGNEDPMGKTLSVNNEHDFIVTGIFKKLPHNVTISFEIAIPFEYSEDLAYYAEGWGNNYLLTFLQLVPNADIQSVNKKLTDIFKENLSNRTNDIIVSPLSRLHLHSYFGYIQSAGAIQYVYMFSIIAVIVLLIACINFMNLATARSANRAKEIGIRKVVGAKRGSLIKQFYTESFLLSVIAAIFSICIVLLLLDQFNELTDKEIEFSIFGNWYLLGGILLITLITGFTSGSYPAVFLSKFKPVSVLSGSKKKGAKNANFRRILVVVQFTLSIFLIVATIVVYKQMLFIQEKDLGYDKENLVYIEMRGEVPNKYRSIKSEFQKTPGVIDISASNHPPYRIASNSGGADWDGKDPNQRVLVSVNFVDYNFCETMGIELLEGRGFQENFPADELTDTDTVGGVLINEEMVKTMGMDNKSVIGARFDFFSNGNVIGVMKDFHFATVKNQIEPLAMGLAPDFMEYMIIRLQKGNPRETLNNLQKSWNRVVADYPFEYKFLDEDIEKMYRSETRMLGLLNYFAILAIVIASLGLFGLASFMAEQRTKEFGVRKV
ncbi:ABC transporter permease, partial [Bacteroidota bacterium]